MFGHQHLAVGARLAQLLPQLVQGLAQVVRLMLLVLGLGGKSGHQLVVAQGAFQGGAGQVVVALLHRHFGLAPPLRGLLLVLGAFLSEQVLVGNGDGHLRLYLKQLVLHVQHDLFQHPLRILGLLHQVVQIGA